MGKRENNATRVDSESNSDGPILTFREHKAGDISLWCCQLNNLIGLRARGRDRDVPRYTAGLVRDNAVATLVWAGTRWVNSHWLGTEGGSLCSCRPISLLT